MIRNYLNCGFMMQAVKGRRRVNTLLVAIVCGLVVGGIISAILNPGYIKAAVRMGRRKIPRGIIIGAYGCSLSYLSDMLQWHPQLVLAWSPNYFDVDENYAKGINWYTDHLPQTGDKVMIERSTHLYASYDAPERVFELDPKMKLLMVTCDPTRRAIQHYMEMKKSNKKIDKFDQLAMHEKRGEVNEDLDFIHEGMYNRHIRRWLEYFPENYLLVLDAKSLETKPKSELRKIEDFFGVNHDLSNTKMYYNETRRTYCAQFQDGNQCFGMDKSNVASLKLSDYANKDMLKRLSGFYEPHNKEFAQIMGKQFLWDNPV